MLSSVASCTAAGTLRAAGPTGPSRGSAGRRGRLAVDRTGSGKILGASLATRGPALGHGFDLDDVSIDQIVALAAKEPPVGWWTHCAGEDGLGFHLGRWSAVRREGEKAVGDFHFSPAAKHVRPEGLSVDAATYLMDLAEQDPEAFGVSPAITFELDQKGSRPVARVSAVRRADFTALPAANPSGLLSAGPGVEAAEPSTLFLERVRAEGQAVLASAQAKADRFMENRHVAAQLREAGWSVELSDDGLEIVKRTPPAPGSRA